MSGPSETDERGSKEYAEKKLAEILSLEEREKLLEQSPPEDLEEINHILEHEVMPILDATGVEITRDELVKMFAEWYARKEAESALSAQAGPALGANVEAVAATATGPSLAARLSARLRLKRLAAPTRRLMRFVGIVIMLVPLILLPVYFFVSTEIPPPVASGVMTLSPAIPLVAPGQTQNYSVLTLSLPATAKVTAPTSLTAFSPAGLSFEMSLSYVSPQPTTTIPVVIHTSAALAPGNYSVVVEEKEGSAVRNQTFRVSVVPALVIMHDVAFVPSTINVTKGTTVYWMNTDSAIGCCDPGYHDVAFRGDGMNVTSPILKRLNTWSYTFETPGEFYFYCTIHPWMVGLVNVTA